MDEKRKIQALNFGGQWDILENKYNFIVGRY